MQLRPPHCHVIIDARTLPDGTSVESTVCIAGAGAAGLTLAYHLGRRKIPVCVVEAGDFSFDRATQKLACGDSSGLPYDPGSTRFRFFGGSTNAWGALLRPISAHCFRRRKWLGDAEWPFERRVLDPYYEEAYAFLDVDTEHADGRSRRDELERAAEDQIMFDDDRLETRISPLARRGIFKDKTKPGLERDTHSKLLLNANVVEVETCPDSRQVGGLRLRTLCGTEVICRAKIFILCMGGLENARLLLLSDRCNSRGLGNAHDLVGRYFMDHPRLFCGRLHPANGQHGLKFYDPTYRFKHMPSVASLSVSEHVQKREELLDGRFYFFPVFRGQDISSFDDLVWLKWKLRATRSLDVTGADLAKILWRAPSLALAAAGHLTRADTLLKHYAIVHTLETAPSHDSRVTLGSRRDALGSRCVHVDWRLGSREKQSIRHAHEVLTDVARKHRIGTIETVHDVLDADPLPAKTSWHHMGTTRMHADPREGVVDADCRLHESDNLYVAGSSVFPTGGDDVPTLTIVALAIRLAEHIESRLS